MRLADERRTSQLICCGRADAVILNGQERPIDCLAVRGTAAAVLERPYVEHFMIAPMAGARHRGSAAD